MLASVLVFAFAGISASSTHASRPHLDAKTQERAQPEIGVERWLAGLSAARAADRSRAQRELAVHLNARDLDLLRASARAGEAEVRRRICAAIASSDRHLDLAVGLASDAASEVSEIGRDALREMLARWSPGYSDPGLGPAEVRTKLRDRSERILSLDSNPEEPQKDGLALVLDQFARAANGAPPIVLDPALATSAAHAFHPNTDLEGAFERVLEGFARAYGVSYVGFAFDAELGESARPWILVTGRADEGKKPASERIIEWCVAVATGTAADREEVGRAPSDSREAAGDSRKASGDSRKASGDPREAPADSREASADSRKAPAGSREAPADSREASAEKSDAQKRSASARALAALDWPAGLFWLEQRWRGAADPSALEGLLLAAGRGRVVASFVEPAVQEELYRAMDAAIRRRDAAGDERAEEIARALSAAGSSGPRGEDLAAIALAQRDASPREVWSRLVVLEGARSASPLVLPFLDSLITRESSPGGEGSGQSRDSGSSEGTASSGGAAPTEREALRFQALRTRAVCARGAKLGRALPEPRALFEWAAAAHELDELVRCLLISGVTTPEEWLDPDRLPDAWKSPKHLDLRVALVEWCVASMASPIASAMPRGEDSSGISSGDPRSGAKQLASLLSTPELSPAFLEKLAVRVRRASQEGEPARVERFLIAARDALRGASAGLDRLEVLSGRAAPDVEQRVLAASTSDSQSDLLCLAALVAGGQGEKARAVLLRSIGGKAAPRDLAAALDRAIAELRAARAEKEERAFVVSVREAARAADPKVRAILRADLWPPPQQSTIVRVSEFDRRLRRSGL